MAGWTDSGSSRGRGGGGGGFANRGVNNMNTRWRERRLAQPQQQQDQQQQQQQHQQHQQQHQQQQHLQQQHQQHHQQHRYRPVNANDQSSQQPHHSLAEEANPHRVQGRFSTAIRRHRQPTHPPQARTTFTDEKSPAPAAEANVNASEPDDKARRSAANFECNVCFDMADDPVVTKCGHLFCWECLYQWLHVHSHHRECPVCKGQVADDAIIPIYGRGGSAASVHAAPPRPTGARVESSRQQQQQYTSPDWRLFDDDDDDDEGDNPYDLRRLAFGASSLTDFVLSLMPHVHTGIEGYGGYTNSYNLHEYDDVYPHDFPFASAGAGSSRRHGPYPVFPDDIMETFLDDTTNYQEEREQEVVHGDFVYRGGRRQRGRARGATYTDRSSMVMGSSSSASYRDTGAGPHNSNTGASSRPNGGWTERRGRSNLNSNSGGGGRGMQNNSRRQGANYN